MEPFSLWQRSMGINTKPFFGLQILKKKEQILYRVDRNTLKITQTYTILILECSMTDNGLQQ